MTDGRLGSMDPNSRNQRWSKWQFDVRSGGLRRPPFADVKKAAAKFGRLHVGSVATMRITETVVNGQSHYAIEVRAEGAPVHDPEYVAWMNGEWTRWAERGFGPGSTCSVTTARLEAGDRQDGSPREQLILFDPLVQPVVIGEVETWRTNVAGAVKSWPDRRRSSPS